MQEDEQFDFKQSRINSLRGVFRTFFWLSREEWTELDHKLMRIVFGVVGFAAVTVFWLYFLRSVTPF